MGRGGFRGAEAVVEGLVPPGEGGEGEGANGSRLLRTPIDVPFFCPSRLRTLPGGCKPGSSPTDTGYGKLGRKPGHPSLQPCTGGG